MGTLRKVLLGSWIVTMVSCSAQPSFALPNDIHYQRGQIEQEQACYELGASIFAKSVLKYQLTKEEALHLSRKYYYICMRNFTQLL